MGLSVAVVADENSTLPNIVFIMADDLGYGDLGCYGSKYIRTPNIDRLATQGMRFTDCYSGSPVCAPARSVLMTGLHSGKTLFRANIPAAGGVIEPFGEGDMRLSMSNAETTIAEILRAAGYRTGGFGKWGLGEPGSDGTPTKKGFQEWLGYLNQNHAAYYYPEYLDRNDGVLKIPENAGGMRAVYSNDLLTKFGLEFMRKNRGNALFLYMPYTVPHELMEVPDLGEYSGKDWPNDARVYAAMVSRFDAYVGRLLNEIDKLGLAENTLVIVTSDNGPVAKKRSDILNSTGGLRGYKGTVYEGGIRVPMIVRLPSLVPTGRTSDAPWMFADFLPTCLELARMKLPVMTTGVSVVSLLRGQPTGERPIYWEYPTDKLSQAVRKGQWKAVRHGRGAVELYDLKTDRAERTDLAARHPEIVHELVAVMEREHVPSPYWP